MPIDFICVNLIKSGSIDRRKCVEAVVLSRLVNDTPLILEIFPDMK